MFVCARYAHKCYLATTALIDNQDKEDTEGLGVGSYKLINDTVTEVEKSLNRKPYAPKCAPA